MLTEVGLKIDGLVMEDFNASTNLKWHNFPASPPAERATVSWNITNPRLLYGPYHCRDGRAYCGEEEVLKYLGLPDCVMPSPDLPDYTFQKARRKILIDYFLMVSRVSGKQVDVYSSTRLYPKETFFLRTEPDMTHESRLKQMREMATKCGAIIGHEDGARRVWLGGSLARGSKHAYDVDLLVVVQPTAGYTVDNYHRESWEAFMGATPLKCGDRDPLLYLPLRTLTGLDRCAEAYGFFLDCMMATESTYNNASCCSLHHNVIENFKNGELLYSKVQ